MGEAGVGLRAPEGVARRRERRRRPPAVAGPRRVPTVGAHSLAAPGGEGTGRRSPAGP